MTANDADELVRQGRLMHRGDFEYRLQRELQAFRNRNKIKEKIPLSIPFPVVQDDDGGDYVQIPESLECNGGGFVQVPEGLDWQKIAGDLRIRDVAARTAPPMPGMDF